MGVWWDGRDGVVVDDPRPVCHRGMMLSRDPDGFERSVYIPTNENFSDNDQLMSPVLDAT